MRDTMKTLARGLAACAALPYLLSFLVKRSLLGPNRALELTSQSVSLLPGLTGQYVRRSFLSRTLASCHCSATIEFGTLFSQAGARIGEHAYIGPRCHLGLVNIERDVLIAAAVHVPSGALTHGTGDAARPIREQPGQRTLVTIGEGSWIGSAAVVLADVGKHCIVAAGAVVTRPIPDYAIAAGVPARVIRDRRATTTAP